MRAVSLMVLGTGSGVGKSLIAAGLCRLLSDWGYRVAPFKAQNMSNNSYVTREGGEMGRAQVVQAECARVEPHVDMNPILLKPSEDNLSQVVIHGKAAGHYPARDYFSRKEDLFGFVRESYERLASQYEIIVIEGAGSPAEINLKDRDIVNMRTAEMADARCLLVGDIQCGGIFAQLLGTLDLLNENERARIDGLIVNKFRGDASLFDDGIAFIEKKSGKKIWGVLPFDRSLRIDEEDAVPLEPRAPEAADENTLDIAVVLLPRLSNFTDFEILRFEPGVRLRYISGLYDFGAPDLLILPGTKATAADLSYIYEAGLAARIQAFAGEGGCILGICGGYQMMGRKVLDPFRAESAMTEAEGLGLFDMETVFDPEKILRRVTDAVDVTIFGSHVQGSIQGYEIHMGKTIWKRGYPAFGREGAIHPSGKILGTYYHGLFDSGTFRASFLNALRELKGKTKDLCCVVRPQSGYQMKEEQYVRLGRMLSDHIDPGLLRASLGLDLALSGPSV